MRNADRLPNPGNLANSATARSKGGEGISMRRQK
jgi:hypothetical protein